MNHQRYLIKILRHVLLMASLSLVSVMAQADRLKDMASIAGVRSNALVGYGLVVGLDGTSASKYCLQGWRQPRETRLYESTAKHRSAHHQGIQGL